MPYHLDPLLERPVRVVRLVRLENQYLELLITRLLAQRTDVAEISYLFSISLATTRTTRTSGSQT